MCLVYINSIYILYSSEYSKIAHIMFNGKMLIIHRYVLNNITHTQQNDTLQTTYYIT